MVYKTKINNNNKSRKTNMTSNAVNPIHLL